MTTLLRRLNDAAPRLVGDLPTGYLVALTDGERRELITALEHIEEHACETCGEPVCTDPSDCDHRTICGVCWPVGCQECSDAVEDDRRDEMAHDLAREG